MQPTLRIVAADGEAGLTAFVVVDSLVNGQAMGGTRMTGTVTIDEVGSLARKMTLKLALAELRIGGAKAGIICDLPSGPERDTKLAAFGRTVRPLLRGGLYLGSDQGISHRDRDVFFGAAGFDVHQTEHGRRLMCAWSELWRHCADVTGFGVCEGTLEAVAGLEGTIGRSVVVQGFGAVGRALAARVAARGFRVVAVADYQGTLYAPRGLPIEKLIEITDVLGTIDRTRLPAEVEVTGPGDQWLDVDTDVLVLAAGGDAIHAGNVGRVRARLVVEGANLPCTGQALEALAARGVPVLPDIVVNTGGAAVTALVLTGSAPMSEPVETLTRWLYDEIGARIRRNVALVLRRAREERKLPAVAAHEMALERAAALARQAAAGPPALTGTS